MLGDSLGSSLRSALGPWLGADAGLLVILKVGLPVEKGLGLKVGAVGKPVTEGALVGDAVVGPSVGVEEGSNDVLGTSDGTVDGLCERVGSSEGTVEGLNDKVGASLGMADGTVEGSDVGPDVG